MSVLSSIHDFRCPEKNFSNRASNFFRGTNPPRHGRLNNMRGRPSSLLPLHITTFMTCPQRRTHLASVLSEINESRIKHFFLQEVGQKPGKLPIQENRCLAPPGASFQTRGWHWTARRTRAHCLTLNCGWTVVCRQDFDALKTPRCADARHAPPLKRRQRPASTGHGKFFCQFACLCHKSLCWPLQNLEGGLRQCSAETGGKSKVCQGFQSVQSVQSSWFGVFRVFKSVSVFWVHGVQGFRIQGGLIVGLARQPGM